MKTWIHKKLQNHTRYTKISRIGDTSPNCHATDAVRGFQERSNVIFSRFLQMHLFFLLSRMVVKFFQRKIDPVQVRAPWLNLEIRPGGQTHQIFTIFGDLVSLPLLGDTRWFHVSGPLFDRKKMDYHSAGRKNAAPFREPNHAKCEY